MTKAQSLGEKDGEAARLKALKRNRVLTKFGAYNEAAKCFVKYIDKKTLSGADIAEYTTAFLSKVL